MSTWDAVPRGLPVSIGRPSVHDRCCTIRSESSCPRHNRTAGSTCLLRSLGYPITCGSFRSMSRYIDPSIGRDQEHYDMFKDQVLMQYQTSAGTFLSAPPPIHPGQELRQYEKADPCPAFRSRTAAIADAIKPVVPITPLRESPRTPHLRRQRSG